jgi:hypothetical protein
VHTSSGGSVTGGGVIPGGGVTQPASISIAKIPANMKYLKYVTSELSNLDMFIYVSGSAARNLQPVSWFFFLKKNNADGEI